VGRYRPALHEPEPGGRGNTGRRRHRKRRPGRLRFPRPGNRARSVSRLRQPRARTVEGRIRLAPQRPDRGDGCADRGRGPGGLRLRGPGHAARDVPVGRRSRPRAVVGSHGRLAPRRSDRGDRSAARGRGPGGLCLRRPGHADAARDVPVRQRSHPRAVVGRHQRLGQRRPDHGDRSAARGRGPGGATPSTPRARRRST